MQVMDQSLLVLELALRTFWNSRIKAACLRDASSSPGNTSSV